MGAAETKAKTFGQKLGAFSKKYSAPMALGLLAVGAAAIKSATEFESSMKKIESLVGLSTEAVDDMTDSVKAMSAQTGRGPAELADAMFFITSAGLRGAVAMETLEAAAKAAAVGLGDAATIADLATSALNAYGSDVLSASDATDVMVAAVREGKLEADALTGSMGRVLPVSSQMGIEFHEVGAAFAAMSRTGTGANEAATQLRSIMVTLLKPTKQAEEALAGMGLSSEGLRQQIKDEGLLSTLSTLKDNFDGNSAATAEVFGNVRALVGVFDLMGANVATTEQIFADMENTTGMLDEAFKITSETASFKFASALADAQLMLVNIGEAILPIATTMVEGIRTLVESFAAMPGPLKIVVGLVAALVVASGPIGAIALAVGSLLWVVGELGKESRLAEERQAGLTAEFVAAGDPASTMIDRMTELAASIRDTGDAADDVTNPIGDLIGSTTAFEEISRRGLLPALELTGASLDDLTAAARSGTDVFDDLAKEINILTYSGPADNVKALDDALVGMTASEKAVTAAFRDQFAAGKITHAQLLSLLEAVDETADAFDDHREEIEATSKAWIQSSDSLLLLNSAGKDGQKMLAEWAAAGKSYTEQALLIHGLTDDVTGSMDQMSFAANMAGTSLSDADEDIAAATEDTGELADAFTLAAEEAGSFADAYTDLMGLIIGEGQAINNVDLLLADMQATMEDLTERTLPEMKDEYFTFTQDATAAIGELRDAGLELGGPEMLGKTFELLDQLDALAKAGEIGTTEFTEMRTALLAMSGLVIPVRIEVDSNVPTSVAGFNPVVRQGNTYIGASGGVVTQPTWALIGEAGPEAVVPLDTAPGASPLSTGSGMGGGGSAYNITVNTGVGDAGQIGAEVVDAITAYERRNGSAWRTA
jgi:TP901 family phage tail tape measure protein